MRLCSTILLVTLLTTNRIWALTPMPDANLRLWANYTFPGCVVGTNIDETHPGVMAATTLNVAYQNVQDLTGIGVFTSATFVDISGNPLGIIDELPMMVQTLSASNCQLTSLNIFTQATYVNVSYNLLTTLDVNAWGQVITLNCSHNQLTNLSGMYGPYYTLQTLNCSYNQLNDVLPNVPYYCNSLDISYNQFTTVPALNQNMGHSVFASHNQITSLAGLYGQLIYVDLTFNAIDSVPYVGQMNVHELDLSSNPLSLGIVELPVGLDIFRVNNTQMPCLPYLNKDLDQLYCTGNSFTCLPNQPDDLVMSATNFGFSPAVCTDSDPCYVPRPTIDLRVFLQGPFDFQTYLMNDDLRAQNLLPSVEPYTALGFTYSGNGWADTLDPAIFSITGPDAIVDWVLVDMLPDPFSSYDGNAAHYSRPALVQRDGDVVGLDGSWPLVLNMNQGRYAVAVRHRNHLGTIERFGEWFYAGTMTVDFTDWVTTACFGQALHGDSLTDPNRQLWSGDVTFNHQLKYAGVANDRDPILVAIGGYPPSNTVVGVYSQEDVNMDGIIKYVGIRNDRDPILQNIGGLNPNAVRNQVVF